jgi:type III restriction enzyme
MDEPQNMESELSQSSIGELKPICTLRYSATHRKQRNVVYRLDPVDAHDLGLVKQIVVADVLQEGVDAKPYIKLLGVKRDPWQAKLELVCRNNDGSLARKAVNVAQGRDLADLTGNSAYDNNWRINEISFDPAYIELTNHGILQLGETIGGSNDAIYREMLRETIREHLRKEAQLRPHGIKVLSLFFVDKVNHYLSYADDGSRIDGKFAQWFDELFIEERSKLPVYGELLPQEPGELRCAYFSVMKKKGGVEEYVDSTDRGNKRDDDAYELIMRDKARLLDQTEPVRFIFSHSALREGWDNPNVFQICALREMGAAFERRQTIGRGLRLPVNQDGERVPDRGIAQLSVVANESYQDFAKSLQEDYVRAGVSIGHVRRGEFSKLPVVEEGDEKLLGYRKSEEIWEHLHTSGFIDSQGRVLSTFNPEAEGFTLNLPADLVWAESQVIVTLGNCKIENFVKSKRKRKPRKLNKELYASKEFEEFWLRISQRTTYRVSVDRIDIIGKSVRAIQAEEVVRPLRIQVTRAGVKLLRGGVTGEELSQRGERLAGTYDLPDIISELQEATSLTRRTLVDILVKSKRLSEFIGNPNDFIQMVKRRIQAVLAETVVEGIQYERIAGSVYELRELQRDGQEERDRFIDQMYEVKNKQKTDFDYVVYDSGPERRFAELLDSREDVKLFIKLPAKFRVPTPVGEYNPDWAILKHKDGEDRMYMIRETKSTSDPSKIRPTEQAKIDCGRKHFAAVGVDDFAKSSPENWNL